MGKNRKRQNKKSPTKLEFEERQVLYDREWYLKFGEGQVLYDDGDPTRTDDQTMNILKECTDFALQLHNDTHMVKFSLESLLLATGDLSTPGSMLDLKFRAKAEPWDDMDIEPKIFRARVSFTHKYVDFVEFLPAYLTPGFQCFQFQASNSSIQPPGQDEL